MKARSTGEEAFWLQLRARGIAGGWVCEWRFHPERKWRFDFAHPALLIAVEIEGSARGGVGRHSYASGMEKDFEKYNTATLMGWRLLRGTTAMAVDGRLAEAAERLMKGE